MRAHARGMPLYYIRTITITYSSYYVCRCKHSNLNNLYLSEFVNGIYHKFVKKHISICCSATRLECHECLAS